MKGGVKLLCLYLFSFLLLKLLTKAVLLLMSLRLQDQPMHLKETC